MDGRALVAMGAATRWSGMPKASTSRWLHGASSVHSALGGGGPAAGVRIRKPEVEDADWTRG